MNNSTLLLEMSLMLAPRSKLVVRNSKFEIEISGGNF
mgnify:CR=1 FL=1